MMDWLEARDETLRSWRELRRSLDERDAVQLLTDINAVCGLCEKAQAETVPGEIKCDRCIAARQYGGCQGINLKMSECVVGKDWEGLQKLVDEFLDLLEKLEIPLTESATSA